MLRRPHLVLANVRRHGDFRGDCGHLAEDLARLEQLVAQIFLHHAPRLLHPLPVGLLRRARKQQLEHHARVAGDMQRGGNVFVDLRAVDVDMQHLGLRRERLRVAQRAIRKANADGDQQIAALHGDVRRVRAVHAQHAQHARVVRRNGAQPHQCGDHRRIHQIGEGRQLPLRAGENHAAAAVDQRLLRLGNQPGRLLQPGLSLHLVALQRLALQTKLHRRVLHGELGNQRLAGGRRILRLGDLHILRDVDQHRAGTAARSDEERLADDIGQLLHPRHQIVVLGDGHRHAGDIRLLKGIRAHQALRHVAGDEDDRRGIHVRRRNRRDQIRRAGAAGSDAHARLAAGARVAVRRVTGVLLVGGQHMPNPILPLVQLVVNRQNRAAGKAEHGSNALLNQTFNQNRRSVEFHLNRSLLLIVKKQPLAPL